MYELPTYVTTKDGRRFDIVDNGDYRVILRCFEAISDTELTSKDETILACFLIFYTTFNDCDDLLELDGDTIGELAQAMFNFFNCGQPESGVGMNTHKKLIDWKDDEQIITAAVNNVAHTEIRALPYLHWWTFMGYYLSVGESVLSTVVSIRNKILSGKKLESYEREFKNSNPHYFTWNTKTREQQRDDEFVKSIWNGGIN